MTDQFAEKPEVPMAEAFEAAGAGETVRALMTLEFADAPDPFEDLTR